MKIVIGFPPLESKKGIPLLSQNRQFQWAQTLWTAYPMIFAYAASLLNKAGYQVVWLDGITQKQSYQEWLEELEREKPDLVVLETKTPVIKKHWKIIDDIKKLGQGRIKTILVGDHVTALPEESFKNSLVDYLITGGDYDFLLLNLANHLAEKEELEPGIWYRKKVPSSKSNPPAGGQNSGKYRLNHNLDSLPFIDRDLTKWKFYARKNSNYLRVPGTYTMFSRDCWWGKCSFCSWTTLYPGKSYRVVKPKRALDEIGSLLENYQIKEIMDDSGSFPVGNWLREFCKGMVRRGYHKRIRISCNMRFNADLGKKDYQLMGKAGFRFVLYGLESANQKTLDKLNKNLRLKQVEQVLDWAKEAGLNPHLTVMVGYPWETKREIQKTLNFTRELLKKGLVDTLQATIVVPYPGTPLFTWAKNKGLLTTLDWERYDMREPILKTELSDKEMKKIIRDFYQSIFSPQFVFRKIRESLSDWDVFKYYVRLGRKFPSKLLDFSKR